MKVKLNWNEKDFDNMDWHDCPIYSISLPQENQNLIFDIDYIFKWVLDEKTNLFKFQISPCTLIFKSVLDLNLNLDFQDSIGISMDEIIRIKPKLSPNGKTLFWTFIIKTDKGKISFTSIGFEQIVKEQPILSDSINIGR